MDSDTHLISQVLLGDQKAFHALVERYQNYVFTITFKVLKNRELAEEVAQDVFIKVYKMLGSFQQKSKFSTWLYTVAYRAALDEARKKKRYAESIEGEDSFLQIEDTLGRGTDEGVQQEDLRKALEKAIQKLKPLNATIITLFYLHEKSVQEIADITGLTTTNIKTKLHRLREQLRKHLISELSTELEDLY